MSFASIRHPAGGLAYSAFSLIELAACLVIVGLLAGAATVSLRGAAKHMTLKDAGEQIQLLDTFWREQAIRHRQPGRLVIDLQQQVLRCEKVSEYSQPGATRQFALPDTLRIAAVRLADDQTIDREVALVCSMNGISSTYAIAIEQINTQNRRWFVVAGMTGQVTPLPDEEQVDAVLEALQSRADAH